MSQPFKRNGFIPLLEGMCLRTACFRLFADGNEGIRKRNLAWKNRVKFVPESQGKFPRHLFIGMKGLPQKGDTYFCQASRLRPGNEAKFKCREIVAGLGEIVQEPYLSLYCSCDTVCGLCVKVAIIFAYMCRNEGDFSRPEGVVAVNRVGYRSLGGNHLRSIYQRYHPW